jgi:hypothetical protein
VLPRDDDMEIVHEPSQYKKSANSLPPQAKPEQSGKEYEDNREGNV